MTISHISHRAVNPGLKGLIWLIIPIFLLVLAATVCGLWPAGGVEYTAKNLRGETVRINAKGLYYWDTVSSAAQMQANDLVTLALGLPLLLLGYLWTLKGQLRGRLLLAGALGFLLYTYVTMAFGAAYNQLFLVYTALTSLCLFAFVRVMMSINLAELPSHVVPRLPRGLISGVLFAASLFLSLAWLSV